MESKFQESDHFISFGNPHLMIMMFGDIAKRLFDITTKEVAYALLD